MLPRGRAFPWGRPCVPVLPLDDAELQWVETPLPTSRKGDPGASEGLAGVEGTPAAPKAREAGTLATGSSASAAASPQRGSAPEEAGAKEGPGNAEALLRRALAQPLTPEQHQALLASASEKSVLWTFCAVVPPHMLPDLVQQNQHVAVEFLLQLRRSKGAGSSDGDYSKYEEALKGMEPGMPSLDVINALLPALGRAAPEFVLDYIARAIPQCQNIKEKSAQSRAVRVLCLFIQSHLRSRLISAQDIFIEVQSFCIDFSRIKEASGLFKLLKSLDSE